jgi:hypothetical protein
MLTRVISTYCNPLSIPNYPIGRGVREIVHGEPTDNHPLWLLDHKQQYRELADPSVLWIDGKWHLYPSCDMAWVSSDNGATWQHHPLNVRDLGYAPTIVQHRGRFLLMASESKVYSANSPLGPFEPIGYIILPTGSKAPPQADPMLFSDDDGRLFFYFGCTKSGGIWAVELDGADPIKPIGLPKLVIPFRPDLYPWEAVGEANQDIASGWVEGAWMLKRDGVYYLIFSAAGTENATYCMGCYTGTSPLGPFVAQKRNPILRNTQGLITGTGHGCIVEGPERELWAFYTVRAGVAHGFERRVGMDRAAIDSDGELYVPAVTSVPQMLPGTASDASPRWTALNKNTRTIGSSSAPNLPGRFAVDDDLRTWWQPADRDIQPILTSSFYGPARVSGVRIVWRDIGLNTNRGVVPGPFQYRVELLTAPDQWKVILDRTNSLEDLLVDYRETMPEVGSAIRLVITGWAKGIAPGVADFTAFGNAIP